MKSVNFQRNKSLIRVVNESNPTIKRNWDRIMYLVLLVLFVLFMIYYFSTKLFYIHAFGHVIIDNTRIRLTDDARIFKFYVNEGDSVSTNDTLFSYALDLDYDTNGDGGFLNGSTSTTRTGDDWWAKEQFALKKKIALNDIDCSENKTLISNYQKEIKRLSNEVILDILPKNRLEFVQNEILRLNTETQKLLRETEEFKKLLKSANPIPIKNRSTKTVAYINSHASMGVNSKFNTVGETAESLDFSEELLTQPKYFKSPMTGIATRIFIHDYETALKSEDIMSLHVAEPAFIKAYFEQEDLKHFKIGDVFTIEFPDGTISEGVLKRFYIATYTLPEEFQKKYEPTTRSIAGDIYPVKPEEIKKWRTFFKMSVDLKKFKYN